MIVTDFEELAEILQMGGFGLVSRLDRTTSS